MKKNWTTFDEWAIIRAHKATKDLIMLAPSLIKNKNIFMDLFREELAFYLYSIINCFRGRLNLSDEHMRELHQDFYAGFNDISWKNAPSSEPAGSKFLRKSAKEVRFIAQDKEFNELVYGYLRGDTSIAGIDSKLFSVIGGIVGANNLADLYEANHVVSFCRILKSMGFIDNRKLAALDFFDHTQIWMLHTSHAIDLINLIGSVLKEVYGDQKFNED